MEEKKEDNQLRDNKKDLGVGEIPDKMGGHSPEKEVDFIKWFSELDKDSGNVAGGKGANLGEMYKLKLPIPPGFVVTAQAYDYFIEKAGIKDEIKRILEEIDYENTKNLEEKTKQIRDLIVRSKLPKEIENEIIESYETLNVDKSKVKGHAMNILKAGSESVFVAVRSSATAEDLATASFAGQQDTYLNIKGNTQLLESVKKCFASLFTARATYYRHKKHFKHEEVSLAVIVQKMIDSDKSGVIFTKDPAHKNENTIIEAVFGLGEGIVSGKISPDKYIISKEPEILDKKIAIKKIAITRDSSGKKEVIKLKQEKAKSQVLQNHEIIKLAEYGLKLEEHYKKPQDIEFAIENENIYILQTRAVTTMETRFETTREIRGEAILSGIAASPGIASGKIRIINKVGDLEKIKSGDILVTTMTNPDMVVTMQKSAAIVTDEGGMTAHAAIVSREMGIPCVVGTQEATTKLKEGEIATVDGFNGKIYKGKVSEAVQKEVLPVIETKTKIKVIVDLPTYAQRAAKSKVNAVGLTRIEGIIAESGKHPHYFLKKDTMQDYEEIIFKGVQGIAEYFDSVWVRTSDIRSDEFKNLEGAPKEKEPNPMLGMHGIRAGLKNVKILKAELNALKRVAEQGKEIGLLLPQLISVEELKQVKEFLKEINFTNAKIGVMIETPASVQIIKELCEEKIDFISFGTNDLTQYTLAVDRGNQDVQYIYDEMHPAVLHQLEHVIKICKEFDIETSICGQAGSRKEMVKFLIEQGINSISVNADAAHEISKYVAELEKGESVEEIEKIAEQEKEQQEQTKKQKAELKEEQAKEKKQEEVEEENKELEDNRNIGDSKKEGEVIGERKIENNQRTNGRVGAFIQEEKTEDVEPVVSEKEEITKVAPSISNKEEITEPIPSEASEIKKLGDTEADKRKEIENLAKPTEPSQEEIEYNQEENEILTNNEKRVGKTQENLGGHSSETEEQEETLDIF